MGFMSGFGKAFSQSFQAERDRSAQRSDDEFKLMYSDYVNRRDDVDKWKREDAKSVNLAKSLTQEYNWPAESWTYVRDQLASGGDETAVRKMMDENNFVVGPNAGQGTATKTAPTDGATPSSGSGPVDPRQTSSMTAPPNQDNDGHAGLLSSIFGTKSGKSSSDIRKSKTMDRIAQLAGVDPSQVSDTISGKTYNPEKVLGSSPTVGKLQPKDATLGGFKLNQLNTPGDAATFQVWARNSGNPHAIELADQLVTAQQSVEQWKARQKAIAEGLATEPTYAKVPTPNGPKMISIIPNPQGEGYIDEATHQPVPPEAQLASPGESKAWDGILKDAANDDNYKKYMSDMQNYVVTKTTGDKMLKIATENPDALTKGGWLAQMAETYKQDYIGITDILKGDENGNITNGAIAEVDDIASKLESDLSSGLGDRVERTSAAYALLEAQKARYVYQWLASQGQSGKSVAVAEFDNAMARLDMNMKPDKLAAYLSSNLTDMGTSLHAAEQGINKFGRAGAFMRQHNINPDDPVAKKMFQVAPSLEEYTGAQEGGDQKPVDTGPQAGTEKSYQGKTYVFQGGDYRKKENWKAK